MQFPYGNAALSLLIVALLTGLGLAFIDLRAAADTEKPDLVFATFAKDHYTAYKPAIEKFEKENDCRIQIQFVDQRALQGRLVSAMQVGAQVPDMVELIDGSMGMFTSGPLENVGFVDLTEKIKENGLADKLVTTRYGKWSSRGRLFALPHDVHPVMLAYRRDVVEQLGIDVNQIKTWDDFVRIGRQVTKDENGDGIYDRYMIDLPSDGGDALRLLMLQRGEHVFDEKGNVAFDTPGTAEVVCWYVRQVEGKTKISFPAGWGQNLAKTMQDATCLFYICPDWRTKQFQADVDAVKGKMALMPLPAWEPGGIRTSTWGGTGLAFTKQSKHFDLAWKLAMYLYFDPEQLGPRYADTYILPPLKSAWTQPEFSEPDPYYSNQLRGQAFIRLADEVPDEPAHTYFTTALAKLSEAFQNVTLHYREHGDEGLEAFALQELKRCAGRVRLTLNRNVFLRTDDVEGGAK